MSKLALLFSVISFAPFAMAEQVKDKHLPAASVEYLTGSGDMHGLRIAYRPDITQRFSLPLVGETRLEWEVSLNLFDIHGSSKNEATYGASLSPVLLKHIYSYKDSYPVDVELGLGISYVHDEKFGGVDIGSDYQFEDRLGLIVTFDEKTSEQVFVRLIHYSNGGLNTKNPGLDFFSIGYKRNF